MGKTSDKLIENQNNLKELRISLATFKFKDQGFTRDELNKFDKILSQTSRKIFRITQKMTKDRINNLGKSLDKTLKESKELNLSAHQIMDNIIYEDD